MIAMDQRHPSRKAFLKQAGAILGAAAVARGPSLHAEVTTQPRRWKGAPVSKVKRWDVITIGNLSRNRYWGEGDAKAVRSVICTCTLIRGDGFRLLVDPSLADAAQFARELDRRTGLRSQDITACFITHEHGDHWAGLASFPNAKWLASPAVAQILNTSARLPHAIEGVTGRLMDALDIIPTPGHTAGHHSLRFDCDGLSIVAAGDAVATRDFFRERRPYFNAVDVNLSIRTIDRLAEAADVIVPGHDNYFIAEL
jgi:glyoxylase-like metal-dependent hydrolase (beta-lactamase superfamily II)